MHIFNSHVHTNNSKDSILSMDEMCLSASVQGLDGISVTDHCEITSFISGNAYKHTKDSVTRAAELKKKYNNILHIGIGTEIGGGIFNPEYTSRILKLADFDVVLASVHTVRYKDKSIHLSREDFSQLPEKTVSDYLKYYFYNLLETAEACDFDVLAHMTLPIRYISAEHGIKIDFSDYGSLIDAVLKELIKRDKALEVNTSEINRIGLMPDKHILTRYRELGGSKITIGTDAHTSQALTLGINDAVNCLKQCGFTHYGYYDKRKYICVPLY